MPVYAQNWMIPDLIRLWRQCFDDPEEYVAFFMAHRFRPEHALVSLQGGKTRGRGLLLALPGRLAQARYGYAVGVAPALRGQGIGGAILSCAEEKCDARRELLLSPPGRVYPLFITGAAMRMLFFCRWWQLDDAGPLGN
jgi:GNAT superfamily N-acetyltransferase